MQKRLKVGDKPNEYVPIDKDVEFYSERERLITQGRYLLEKKTKVNM